MGRTATLAIVVIAAILATGLLWGGVIVVEGLIFRGELPQGTWWQLLLAIPIIGAIALFFEGIGEGIGRAFRVNERGTPKWKEYLAAFTAIGVVVAILVLFNWLR